MTKLKKIIVYSLQLIVYSQLSILSWGYVITHNDYTSNTTITASGQNTNENNIVNVINGNLDSTNITANTLPGSTANSGGSAGSIQQGTISSPDFRTNAVSTTAVNGGSGHTTIYDTVITSTSITTIGQNVLVLANCDIRSLGTANMRVAILEDGNNIANNDAVFFNGSGIDYENPVPIMLVRKPAAGVHTYSIGSKTFGGSPSVGSCILIAIELRT